MLPWYLWIPALVVGVPLYLLNAAIVIPYVRLLRIIEDAIADTFGELGGILYPT